MVVIVPALGRWFQESSVNGSIVKKLQALMAIDKGLSLSSFLDDHMSGLLW